MNYTEQELNALFDAVMVGASPIERSTPILRESIRTSVVLFLDGRATLSRRDPYTLDLPAVLRLMREAREQGAADMRERAASVAEVCSGGDAKLSKRDLIAANIRALTIPRDC